MKKSLVRLLVRMLRDVADKIEGGNCELSETEASDIMEAISHKAMSKEEVCTYLNMSRSRFDDLVREGKFPKGKKRRGFKELVFYKDEIDKCVSNVMKR